MPQCRISFIPTDDVAFGINEPIAKIKSTGRKQGATSFAILDDQRGLETGRNSQFVRRVVCNRHGLLKSNITEIYLFVYRLRRHYLAPFDGHRLQFQVFGYAGKFSRSSRVRTPMTTHDYSTSAEGGTVIEITSCVDRERELDD